MDEKVKTEVKDEPGVKQEPDNNPPAEVKLDEKKPADPLLNMFYSEIDEIKPEDFKSNSKEQLNRLLRPGSTYFNLNPFEVLQIDPYANIEEIKKKYRKLSIYVHPDKNPDDLERAQVAFEAVNRAYKLLENEKERKKCLEVVEEATEKVNQMCEEKRKKLRLELKQKQSEQKKSSTKSSRFSNIDDGLTDPNSVKIDEDDPDKFRHSVYVMTCKLFADIERLKVRESEKQAEEKKRKAEEKVNDEVKTKIKKEWDKNYEESREGRVSSWKDFMTKKGASSASQGVGKSFKLPKHKPEKR